MERRLAAILAADVAGYTALMGADEAGTLRRLSELRREFLEPLLDAHHGRVVKLMGDGFLVEFSSVVDAVACALAWQAGVAERDRELRFRIGINLGDVIVEDDDIHGDGVNIAARLEGLAEPGGICLSGDAYRQARGRVEAEFQDMGEQALKNVAEPVRAYRVLAGELAAGAALPLAASPKRTLPWAFVAGGLALLVIFAALAIWLAPWAPREEPASLSDMAFPLPDKPSIAVLPFSNLSEDRSQEYFADGMSEDLITDLSKLSGLFVIARNSSFSYKGRQVKVRQVAEELGVRYVLEGSVRRAGEQVRINVQLIDATTGGHVWAERFDGNLADVFAFQDHVTEQIVEALAVNLTGDERLRQARQDTVDPGAHDAFLQGWEYYRRHTPKDFAKAIRHFERAIERDPSYGRAYSALALVYWKSVRQGYPWTREITPDSSDFVSFTTARTEAERFVELALRNPTPLAYQVSSGMSWTYRQFDDAVAKARLAVDLDPNNPDGHVALAWALIFNGEPQAAVSAVEQARRLDPDHPQDYLYVLGMAKLSQGRFEEAVAALEGAQEWSPHFRSVNVPLAASYAHLDRHQDAQQAFDRYWQEWTFSANTLADILGWWPYRFERDMRRLGEGLIMTGLGSKEELDAYIRQLRRGGTLN